MMKIRLPFILSLCVFALPYASYAHDSTVQCPHTKSTADLVQCLNKKHGKLQEALNTAYSDVNAPLNTEQQAALKEAQNAWVSYRDLECTAEAQSVENVTLARAKELECLSLLTQNRIDVLSDMIEEEPVSQIGMLPRWMNVLGKDNPDIHWDYSARIEADLDCDEQAEYVMRGLEYKDGSIDVLVAVAESAVTGKPKTDLFRFSLKDTPEEHHDICAADLSLSLSKVEEAEDTAEEKQCTQRLILKDNSCFEATLSSSKADGYVLSENTLMPKPELTETAAGDEGDSSGESEDSQ